MAATSHNPLISVIIPVYNVRPYLERCFHSLTEQTYTNLEVIFVDDCSSDDSYEECVRLCATDERFHVLKQAQNGGAGHARQRGIEASTGEFIGFVDGDDFAEPDLYKELLDIIITTEADIACCNAFYAYEEGRKWPIFPPSATTEHLTSGEAQLRMHLKKGIGYSLWDKLFRRNIPEKIPMRTQPFEDHAVLPLWFREAKIIGLRLTPQYRYIQHAGSLMHSGFNAQKEFRALQLFYRDTRMLETEYGIKGLNTVVRKGVHYLNHLCLLSPSDEVEKLRLQAIALVREYDHVPLKQMGVGLRVKRWLLLNHFTGYRSLYTAFVKLFAPKKYHRMHGSAS